MPRFWVAETIQDFLLVSWDLGGGKVSTAPLMAMVADGSGRSCFITLAMLRPVRSWMPCGTARAVNTMVRCADLTITTRGGYFHLATSG